MKTRKPDEPVMCLQCGVPMVMTPNGHWACPTTIEAKRMLELAITNPVDRAALAGAAVQPTVATAMKHGDYVLATKYDDGDPGDQFAVGHYDRFDCERHYVTDAEGKQFRGNGFRRCEPVTPYEGAWLISHFPEFVPLELVERDDGEDYLAGKSVWDWLAEARATDQQDVTP